MSVDKMSDPPPNDEKKTFILVTSPGIEKQLSLVRNI